MRERGVGGSPGVETRVGLRVRVRGVVQGIGFRPWIASLARALDLAGHVRNDGAGVVLELFGSADRLATCLDRIAHATPGAAQHAGQVSWTTQSLAAEAARGFTIEASEPSAGAGALPIAPDLATCAECLRELSDPTSRRHRDPFISCAGCGPRFSVLRTLPFDRERTSLDAFPRCAACEAEYRDPQDRRYHAQTCTCPACGPSLTLRDVSGARRAEGAAAIAGAAQVLARGDVLALLGVGGFHLACDARNANAVATLRARKQRARKPLAVMVRDLADAETLAVASALERTLLCSAARPIVLLERRADAALAEGIAPDGPRIGLLLPYTGLHQLLIEAAGGPLVMTSGNRAGEPLAHAVCDGLLRLGKIADAFLLHDREVLTACDDSVVAVVAGEPTWLRRSRGLVPQPIPLARPIAQPVLAVGGHLHNTVCLAVGDRAYLSRHHGDLDSPEACDAFVSSIEQLVALVGVTPSAIAHDLHPLYRSTAWARDQRGARTIAVQHHHAHVASVLAEHGQAGPVYALAFDGTGYGTDGSAWGGELVLADLAGFARLATLRPLRLAGGEIAIREVWRLALAVLDDAFDGNAPWERLGLARHVPPARFEAVRGLLGNRALCVPAHGAGRWFDALGALVLGIAEADFQGEVALAWNHAALACPAAWRRSCPPYPFDLELDASPWQLDLRPSVRALVADVLAGIATPQIAARFHATLAEGAAAWLREAVRRHGPRAVVLAGGCFQNGVLVERLSAALPVDAALLRARQVPPGDGGLALGQAVVADALLRGESSLPCV